MFSYKYPRPAVTVDAIVFSLKPTTKILLIQRKNPPFQNQWALPGGFLDMDETVEQAVKRELQEETGLVLDNLEQFKVFSAVNRDPRGRTLSVVFVAKIETENQLITANDDAKSVKWFDINNLPNLAFDHQIIINETIEKYKYQTKHLR